MNFTAAHEALSVALEKIERRPLGVKEEKVSPSLVHVSGTFLTREEAEDAIRAYLDDFNPLGYGTAFGPINEVHGYFTIRGSRAVSCD